MTGVDGRVALITGVGSPDGIGYSCARLLKRAGAKIAITSTTNRIFERQKELGEPESVYASVQNLTNPNAAQDLVKAVESNLGSIDIIINNAGMVEIGKQTKSYLMHNTTDEAWHYGIDINLTTAFYITRATLPTMIEKSYGRIVNISSVTGPIVGIPGSVVYASAKAGMLGMARGVATEVGSHNITINCIGPGWIHTGSSSQNEIIAGKFTPTGRPGSPDEVGHVAVFLASEEASYVNGQMIVVDGGNTIQEYKVAFDN